MERVGLSESCHEIAVTVNWLVIINKPSAIFSTFPDICNAWQWQ